MLKAHLRHLFSYVKKLFQSRDTYKNKLESAKDNINRVEEIVASKVRTAIAEERKESERIKHDNEKLLDRN